MNEQDRERGPHYGEPSSQDPDMGEGGEAKPDTSAQAGREEEAKERAKEAGSAAEEKAGEGGWTPTQS